MQKFLDVNPKEASEFFKVFSTMGISNSTRYDWTRLSEQVRSPEKSVQTTVVAPAGKHVQVKQVVAYCDLVTVRTEAFRSEEMLPSFIENCIPEERSELVLECNAIGESVKYYFQMFYETSSQVIKAFWKKYLFKKL